jgi:hypothetical protein
MKLLYSLPTTITVGNSNIDLRFDGFKILTSHYDVVLFITTNSIKHHLNVDVEPQGTIKGHSVVDVQTMVDTLEQCNHPTFDILSAEFDLIQEIDCKKAGYIKWECVKHLLPKLSKSDLINTLKLSTQSMSEDIYFPLNSYKWLMSKYSSKSNNKSKAKSKGFAAAAAA